MGFSGRTFIGFSGAADPGPLSPLTRAIITRQNRPITNTRVLHQFHFMR